MRAAELPPVACTLDLENLGARVARIRRLTEQHLLCHQLDGRMLRLLYRSEAAAETSRIVELERECCAFLEFSLAVDAKQVALTISAPESAGDAAQWLFGQFLPGDAAQAVAPGCGCQGGTCAG